MANTSTIDLNCDLGEAAGHDLELLPLVSSANIACGAHAGDAQTMAATATAARRHRVQIGAHPGHADRRHFGRREISLTPDQAASLVVSQVHFLENVIGGGISHVKLHGGLYHQVAREASLARAVASAMQRHFPAVRLVLPAGSLAVRICRDKDVTVIEEAFADRAYADNGTLLPRSRPNAVLGDHRAIARQAVRLVTERIVTSTGGRELPLHADTLCIHGDGPDPAGCLRAVRDALSAAGVVVRPPADRDSQTPR